MQSTFKVSGFFAAHAVCSIAEHGTFTPMMAHVGRREERKLERFAGEDFGSWFKQCQSRMHINEMNAKDAVVLYNDELQMRDDFTNAIFVMMCSYSESNSKSKVLLAVPYEPNDRNETKLTIFYPEILASENWDESHSDKCLKSFFDGIESHEKGFSIWRDSISDA